MALNIKDPETARLAAEVAELAGESKTRAVRVALQERKQRLELLHPKKQRKSLRQFLEEEIWPFVPPEVRGTPISKAEREEILGIGPDGV
ncbi:MAG TPA: type II toxin-antitoxin system VapB family antitoxin [Chloroflexota bacterium]|nr:type II toxin-antitoxin system VapB family antitoxin [Chloroflexota bacterium]